MKRHHLQTRSGRQYTCAIKASSRSTPRPFHFWRLQAGSPLSSPELGARLPDRLGDGLTFARQRFKLLARRELDSGPERLFESVADQLQRRHEGEIVVDHGLSGPARRRVKL